MKEYNKSSKLEHVAYDIRGPVLEEAMRMCWQYGRRRIAVYLYSSGA